MFSLSSPGELHPGGGGVGRDGRARPLPRRIGVALCLQQRRLEQQDACTRAHATRQPDTIPHVMTQSCIQWDNPAFHGTIPHSTRDTPHSTGQSRILIRYAAFCIFLNTYVCYTLTLLTSVQLIVMETIQSILAAHVFIYI